MNLMNAIWRLKSQRYDQAVIAAMNFEPNAICIEDFAVLKLL
jgi:hypothetical protein